MSVIENFRVRKEVFENTAHEALHFELMLDSKEYQGHFKNGEVNWLQMQPNPDDHKMSLEELDAEVRRRITEVKEED